jgi:hypothetical protein
MCWSEFRGKQSDLLANQQDGKYRWCVNITQTAYFQRCVTASSKFLNMPWARNSPLTVMEQEGGVRDILLYVHCFKRIQLTSSWVAVEDGGTRYQICVMWWVVDQCIRCLCPRITEILGFGTNIMQFAFCWLMCPAAKLSSAPCSRTDDSSKFANRSSDSSFAHEVKILATS